MRKYGKGWFNESERHRLARLGVATGRKVNYSLGINYATNISIGNMFFAGETKGKYNNMEIIDKGDKTLLVGYGWAVYGSRDKQTGEVTFYKGWDGYSRTTSKQLSQAGLRGAKKVSDKAPRLTDYAMPEKKEGTQFGVLTPEGKVTKSMSINIGKVKSSDPLAYSYGYFQAKSGQPMSKDKDLAKEYVRGYNDAKAGKKIDMAKIKIKRRFPYVIGETVYIKDGGAGKFVKYTEDGKIIVEQYGGYKFKYPQKKISPYYNITRKKIDYMMGASYPTKKSLKESIGKPLRYVETSMFGPEYKENGTFTVVGPDAYTDRKWYAMVTMKNGLIEKVK